MTTTPDLQDPRPSQGRIVVGVDGSEQGGKALRWALGQAVLTGAEVQAIACWSWPSYAGGFTAYEDFDPSGWTTDQAKRSVDSAVADTPGAAAISVHTQVVEGYAPAVLVRSAIGADALVVGSRGHGELHGLVLGSVGLHCATHATCPVVVVRPTAA